MKPTEASERSWGGQVAFIMSIFWSRKPSPWRERMAYLRLPIESVAKPGWNPGTPVYFGFSGTGISTEVGMT